jgi:putative PIN family toxin of toxin-antitoxin system
LAAAFCGKFALIDPPTVVLDTNAVLDWFVFDDPSMHALADGIRCASVTWLRCRAMATELRWVLSRPQWQSRLIDVEHVLTSVTELSVMIDRDPVTSGSTPRCSDASDQMFVDLAVQCRAQWLITKDRALLKLHRKLRTQGISVCPAQHWRPVVSPTRAMC